MTGETGRRKPVVAALLSLLLLGAVVVAVFVNPFVLYKTASGSMHPTLLAGDYLVANADAYINQLPERGDIVVFREPRSGKYQYIMRIVGLPGERIQMVRGILHINGKPVRREQIEDFEVIDPYGDRTQAAQYIETLPNGREHRIIEVEEDSGPFDSTGEIVVPEAHYFAMGDNRDNSADSRLAGTVPAGYLVGRAEVLYFSLESDIAWWQVWRWPGGIRYERIGMKLD